MTDAKKFMFDANNFDDSAPGRALYTEEQLLLAKEQGLAQGRSEGVRDTQAQQEARIVELLQKTLAHAEKLVKDEDRREVEKSADTVRLVMKIVHRLLPGFAKRQSLAEIENVITQSIETRRDEPRIAVTVPSAHLEALRPRMDALAAEKGYGGKVILIADDNLAGTDCRVEWADGGAERLYERLFSQVENELTKAVAGMDAALEENQKK
jgi:flagellar assembly protein FliH